MDLCQRLNSSGLPPRRVRRNLVLRVPAPDGGIQVPAGAPVDLVSEAEARASGRPSGGLTLRSRRSPASRPPSSDAVPSSDALRHPRRAGVRSAHVPRPRTPSSGTRRTRSSSVYRLHQGRTHRLSRCSASGGSIPARRHARGGARHAARRAANRHRAAGRTAPRRMARAPLARDRRGARALERPALLHHQRTRARNARAAQGHPHTRPAQAVGRTSNVARGRVHEDQSHQHGHPHRQHGLQYSANMTTQLHMRDAAVKAGLSVTFAVTVQTGILGRKGWGPSPTNAWFADFFPRRRANNSSSRARKTERTCS